ncbi:exopolygalacturonase-like [Momordica charantia]|uniref:Exopolygalacturonase-like n=1 Tax=Momordica charantia TaxID=3673 RepID=A0A6J1DTV4_MOMCH|nr:exopolygalacturonase-like [Momordica charantia]
MDNSKTLSSAWSEACANNGGGVVLVPHGKFLVWPVRLQGPCNGPIGLRINGILFPPAGNPLSTLDDWLSIRWVNNLAIDGEGWLNGRGSTAWSCHSKGGGCGNLPITLKLTSVNTATIRDITSINSKRIHFNVHGCHDITFDHVTVIAPDKSPNTDGIHISRSTGINIKNSVIGTGDDCISLGPGSKDINITNVHCGPGHGISIGSLGRYPNEEDVTGITVRDSTFTGTTNGVRIKSWSTSLPSVVSKIAYINLQMNNVKNPIIIDESYCIDGSCDPNNKRVRNLRSVGF